MYGNYVDEVLTMDRGGQTFYDHQNALWSVAAVTDGAGAPLPPNAWGTPHSAIGNPYLFTGREHDEETGIYFYRAHYYDCEKGRFLQRDPLGYVDGMNLYEYVKGNPINYNDPERRRRFCGAWDSTRQEDGFVICMMWCMLGITAADRAILRPIFTNQELRNALVRLEFAAARRIFEDLLLRVQTEALKRGHAHTLHVLRRIGPKIAGWMGRFAVPGLGWAIIAAESCYCAYCCWPD
ncbi:MAG: RHS repeat-associated core domain-containing protein [Abditibacteriales bacterium]|nr:RHS repeat-associated core domain-containing protein [Abditibacteriales bacterium]MDW8366613.1 RHS repeat-associated core domain-containing protein [Abditibacteriales bacterium]